MIRMAVHGADVTFGAKKKTLICSILKGCYGGYFFLFRKVPPQAKNKMATGAICVLCMAGVIRLTKNGHHEQIIFFS